MPIPCPCSHTVPMSRDIKVNTENITVTCVCRFFIQRVFSDPLCNETKYDEDHNSTYPQLSPLQVSPVYRVIIQICLAYLTMDEWVWKASFDSQRSLREQLKSDINQKWLLMRRTHLLSPSSSSPLT